MTTRWRYASRSGSPAAKASLKWPLSTFFPSDSTFRSGWLPAAAATGLNDHLPFAVRQENDEWIIEVPLRNGDGELVMLEELP